MLTLHSAFSHLILLSPRPLNHSPISQSDVVFVIRPPMRVQGTDETLQLWMSHDVTPPCHVTPRPCVTHHMSRGCDCDLIGLLVITMTLDWLMKKCASCHQTQVTIITTSWHVSFGHSCIFFSYGEVSNWKHLLLFSRIIICCRQSWVQ